MYPVLVGSRALAHWNKNFQIKDSTDWDVISYDTHDGCEIHDPQLLNNKSMTGYASHQIIKLPDGKKAFVMSMLGLAIMKRSHLWRNLNFDRHITMYHRFGLHEILMDRIHIDIVASDLAERTKLTNQQFPVRTPNLMQTTSDFFDDAVTKKYSHDWLHDLYAYNDKPMYTKMQRNPELAWCIKDLWDSFTELEKCQCVAEEVYVIATERFLVPREWNYSYRLAYIYALNKVCTTLCSGWFRDYAIDNYPKIFDMFDKDKFFEVKYRIEQTPELERKNHE